MNTRLAEKLTALRKAYHFSQAEIAQKLNLTVQDYMDFENGNEFCGIEILQKLVSIYKVPLQSLVDNRQEVPLPRIQEDVVMDSVEIPFQTTVNAKQEDDFTAELMPISNVKDTLEETKAVLFDYDAYAKMSGGDTIGYDATLVQQIVDDKQEPVSTLKKKSEMNQDSSHKPLNRTLFVLVAIASIALAVLVALGLKKLFNREVVTEESTSIVSRNTVNRLALASDFAVYVKDNGDTLVTGSRSLTDFTEIAQIVAGDSHELALKTDGTVLCDGTGSACDVKDWKNIQMIAAGTNHSVGLKSDGTVLCTGTTEACDVSKWTDVKEVYAGNHITVGKKTDGKLLISGNVANAAKISSIEKVASVAIGESQLAILDNTGKVVCFPIGTGSTSNTAAWTGIRQVAVGSQFVAGLKSDGTVIVASTEDTYAKEVSTWKAVKYIAGYKNTLIAVDGTNTIIGAGDNRHQVYGKIASSTPEASATPTADTNKKLLSVKNIQYSVNRDNVVINWDAVDGAMYYLVEVNTNPMTSVKAAANSTSISINKLVNGATYKLTITPIAENKENNGLAQTSAFTYQIEPEKLATPVGISGEAREEGLLIRFNRVEKATKYIVKVGDKQKDTTELSVIFEDLPNGPYTVSVVATNEDKEHFTASEAGTLAVNYTAVVKEYEVIVNFVDENKVVRGTINVGKFPDGTVKTSEDGPTVKAPVGFKFSDDTVEKKISFTISKGPVTVSETVVPTE